MAEAQGHLEYKIADSSNDVVEQDIRTKRNRPGKHDFWPMAGRIIHYLRLGQEQAKNLRWPQPHFDFRNGGRPITVKPTLVNYYFRQGYNHRQDRAPDPNSF